MSFTERIHFFILSNYTNIVILNEVKNLISVSHAFRSFALLRMTEYIIPYISYIKLFLGQK